MNVSTNSVRARESESGETRCSDASSVYRRTALAVGRRRRICRLVAPPDQSEEERKQSKTIKWLIIYSIRSFFFFFSTIGKELKPNISRNRNPIRREMV